MLSADQGQSSSQPVDLGLERDEVWSANASIYTFKWALWMAAVLIASGIFHLAKLGWDGADWNGPLSLRKPGLFGVSAGLTVWSIAWLMTQFSPLRFDRMLCKLIAGSLQGRDRFDWDAPGGLILGFIFLLCIYPVTMIARAIALLLWHRIHYERKEGMAKLASPKSKQTLVD